MATKFDPCKGPKIDAKNHLKAVKAENLEACECARRYRPEMAGASHQEVAKRYTLLMARHTIAKDLGFESWKALEANPPKAEKASAANTPVARPLPDPFDKPNAQLFPYSGTGIPKLESTADKLGSMGAVAEIKGRTWEADLVKEGADTLEAEKAAREVLGHTDDLEDLDKVTREIMGHSPEVELIRDLDRTARELTGRTREVETMRDLDRTATELVGRNQEATLGRELAAAFGITPEAVAGFAHLVQSYQSFAREVAGSEQFRAAMKYLREMGQATQVLGQRAVEELNARPELVEMLKALAEASKPQEATIVIPRR